jgi:hypothetical protein
VGTHAIPVLPEILIQVKYSTIATGAPQRQGKAHGDNKFKGNESVKTPSEHDILPEKDY